MPTKNIESAFELILGLVKEQSSQIVDLNKAHFEVVKKNDKICASLQNAVDGLARENAELSADLRTLKEDHSLLLQSHGTLSSLVDILRHETEVSDISGVRFLQEYLCSSLAGRIPKRTYILLGDVDCEPQPASMEDKNTNTQENAVAVIIEIEVDHSSRGVEVNNLHEGTNFDGVTSGVNVGDKQSENHAEERFNNSAKRSLSLGGAVGRINFPMNAERTVAARLNVLEQSLVSFTEKTSCTGQVEDKPTEIEALVDVKRRIDNIEAVLQGFEQDHKKADATMERELKQLNEIMSVQEETSALATVENVKAGGPAYLKPRQVVPPSDITAEQLCRGYDVVVIERQVAELSDRLQKQISELLITMNDKVAIVELETRIQEIRNLISACSNESSTRALLFDQEQMILELKANFESNMMDKDSYKHQLEHLESDMNSLICREISKLRVDISTSIESQRHELTRLRNESIKEEYSNARIQEATDALRVSLDERINSMRSIESEMNVFASKLAEKPSQDQIDSVLQLLNKRLGHDVELQGILENMKLGEWYPKRSTSDHFA